MDAAQILNTVLSGGGVLTAGVLLYRARTQNRKDKAETGKTDVDAASTLSAAALALLEPYKSEVAELSEQVKDLGGSLSAAQSDVVSLRRQVTGLTHEVTELRDENNRYRELHGPLPA